MSTAGVFLRYWPATLFVAAAAVTSIVTSIVGELLAYLPAISFFAAVAVTTIVWQRRDRDHG